MIDIENEVFNNVANVLRGKYEGLSIYGEYVETPSSFPSVSLVEEDNSEVEQFVSITREDEKVVDLMYSVNVYSNLTQGKKAQAKAIMNDIDEELHRMGFIRTMRQPMPNMDRTIYRMIARYSKRYQKFS